MKKTLSLCKQKEITPFLPLFIVTTMDTIYDVTTTRREVYCCMTNIRDNSQIFRNPLFLISSRVIYNTTMQMNVNLHSVGAKISMNAIIIAPMRSSTTGIWKYLKDRACSRDQSI